jgi:hypothetical protein
MREGLVVRAFLVLRGRSGRRRAARSRSSPSTTSPLLHNPVVPRTILTTNNTTWTQEAKGAAPKDMPSSATKKGGRSSRSVFIVPRACLRLFPQSKGRPSQPPA